MFVIKDDNNKVIYKGSDGNYVYDLLLSEPEDVTERDEVKYEDVLRTEWRGKIRLLEYEGDKLIINIQFKGIDYWNRPIFKDVIRNQYYGDVNKLWTAQEAGEDYKILIDYYKDNIGGLEFFGYEFDCEPLGGLDDRIKLNIIN